MKRLFRQYGLALAAGCVLLVVLAAMLWPSKEEVPASSGEETASSAFQPASDPEEEPAPEEVPVDLLAGSFGFTNGDGTAFLVPRMGAEPEQPELLDRAVGENGRVIGLEYAGKQEGTAQDTGRFTADNFENIPGWLYKVTEGQPGEGETYYAVWGPEAEPALLALTPGDQSPLGEDAARQLEEQKNRPIRNSWLLAGLGEDTCFYLVLFEPEGNNLLASLVAVGPEGLCIRDYPARLEGSSAWRVDDGGTMDPRLFQLVFAARDSRGLVIGITWLGAEGESTVILGQNGEALEECGPSLYRYTSIA